MPKVMVRKCPKTGEFFQSDVAYREHLRKLRKSLVKQRLARYITKAASQVRKAAIDNVRTEIGQLQSIKEIEAYVMESWSDIMIAYNGSNDPKIHEILREVKIKDFELHVRFSESCGNTHCAPRDGETNWGGGNHNAPRGYPGYSGSVSYQIVNDPDKRYEIGNLCLRHSDALAFAGIHTGTGGGRGNDRWQYGVTLFFSDFDGLNKLYFKDKLEGKNRHFR